MKQCIIDKKKIGWIDRKTTYALSTLGAFFFPIVVGSIISVDIDILGTLSLILILLVVIGTYLHSSISFGQIVDHFCAERSIIVKKRNTQGYKNAFESYIANQADYYSEINDIDKEASKYWQNYVKEFRCKNCKEKISLYTGICQTCHELTPVCTFCTFDAYTDNKIVVFMCCGSYIHRTHVESIMNLTINCPNCKQRHPKIIRVRSDN